MLRHEFWRGRRVLLTGHTGFKGAWTMAWLRKLGSQVTGLSLKPNTNPSLFDILDDHDERSSVIGDIRHVQTIERVIEQTRPEIVLHLAAQSLVRRSYVEPIDTFDVNVQGTLILLNALRNCDDLKVCLAITSDKVYENDGTGKAFHESDRLGGTDPYSASKAACEIATSSFARSFYAGSTARIATARAGNVIGGGDWSDDRLVPDLWRARQRDEPVALRYPLATRPWQHVLEPICGYQTYVEALADGLDVATLNFGPRPDGALTVSAVVEKFNSAYDSSSNQGKSGWVELPGPHPKEAKALAINSEWAQTVLRWRPRLNGAQAINWTAKWYAAFDRGGDMNAFTNAQISEYEELA